MTNDSKERYGSVSRIFHWGMAFLIVWQGLKFFDRINEGEHWVGQTLVPATQISSGASQLLIIAGIVMGAKGLGGIFLLLGNPIRGWLIDDVVNPDGPSLAEALAASNAGIEAGGRAGGRD